MKDGKTKKLKVPNQKRKSQVSRVWINPNSTFKGPRGNRTWGGRQLAPPTAARFLELADIALGALGTSHLPVQKKKSAA